MAEFETRHLRHIVTLARCGTFSSAARALGLSQPALTRSIQAVERDVGVTLFDRHPRGVTPTPMGEVVLARALEVLALVSDLHRELDLMQGVGTGTLHVGAGPAMRHQVVPEALVRVCRRHPRLNVQIHLGDWKALSRALLDRDIDVMLAERSEAEGDERFEVLPLPSEIGVWCVRPEHPLAGEAEDGEIPGPRLAMHTLALPRIPERLSVVFRPLIGEGKRAPASVVQCDDVHVLRALALRGDVVALLSESIARDELRSGALVALPVSTALPATRPGAIWLRGRSLSPAGRSFLEALEADAAAPGSPP